MNKLDIKKWNNANINKDEKICSILEKVTKVFL